MRKVVGLFFWGLLMAQGWESLKDSLLIENERIETLELDQRPFPQLPQLHRPTWSLESAVWDSVPSFPLYKPNLILPARPIWTKHAPLHASYSLGRFWTHTAMVSWGRTRDLYADEGLSFTHRSTRVGHVRFARWGHTHLSGWVGRYTSTRGWEIAYRGGLEKFVQYAPYSERWVGFEETTPLIDSLKRHYWRQELRLLLYEHEIGAIRFVTRRLDWDTGVPEWQFILTGEGRSFPVAGWNTRPHFGLFIEGRRFLIGTRWTAEKRIGSWHIFWGLRVAGGRDTSVKFLVAPITKVLYSGLSSYLRPYAEVTGDLSPLTYFSASEMNPYLRHGLRPLPLSREWLNAQVGIQGQGAGWDYRLAGEYRLIQGALSYVPQGANFSVEGIPSFQSLGVMTWVSYSPVIPGPYAEMRAVYRTWRSSREYYSLPPWELWIRSSYPIQDKLLLNFGLYGIGTRLLAPQVQAAPYVDISWGVQVRVMSFMSIFAEMNNLLNRRFYRWYGYVERPMDFWFGIWTKVG